MLQLHLSEPQFSCLPRWGLYMRCDGTSHFWWKIQEYVTLLTCTNDYEKDWLQSVLEVIIRAILGNHNLNFPIKFVWTILEGSINNTIVTREPVARYVFVSFLDMLAIVCIFLYCQVYGMLWKSFSSYFFQRYLVNSKCLWLFDLVSERKYCICFGY